MSFGNVANWYHFILIMNLLNIYNILDLDVKFSSTDHVAP